jgi:hypothetical protein
MSEAVKQKMDLVKLKTFLDSVPNIEFLTEAEELLNFGEVVNTHLRMLQSTTEPISFVLVDASQPEIDNWLLSSFDLFDLSDTFYLKTEDFSAAQWVKVRVHGTASDWLLPMYHQLTNYWLQLVPTSLQYVYEFREQEHHFVTFIDKVEKS